MSFSRQHYSLLANGGPDTPESVAQRLAHANALQQVRAELAARYPVITVNNASEAIEWQYRRIRELLKL